MAKDSTSVAVALRMRPLVPNEISRGCKSALELFPDVKQVKIKGTDKAFTYDYTFDERSSQEEFYKTCVSPLIGNLFKGYNVTILAYGQTGSGKTHSMGTAYNGEGEMGIIPRVVTSIFNNVRDMFTFDFTVSVSFMELYQEVLYDLLSPKPRDQSILDIREDVSRSVFIPGLTERIVTNVQDTLECLSKGSLGRATSCTNMNAQSSRSHAIFTINITMLKKGDDADMLKHAKFHLVDLAGSERSKKTGATGQTFKEGININKGLLALGNVISALGDEASYVGYRDSNLTRLLKDSLGGNSITLMIACISPADYNVEETMSTLRYADRAKKIKNKPIVNEDPRKAEINRLNRLVEQLKLELAGQGGPSVRLNEFHNVRSELSVVNTKLSMVVTENAALLERMMLMQASNEELLQKIVHLKNMYNSMLDKFHGSLETNNIDEINENVANLRNIQSYLNELDEQYKKNEEEIRQHEIHTVNSSMGDDSTEKEIYEKRKDHTTNQMEMNLKLQEVTKMLSLKEDLAKRLMANTDYMVDVEEVAEDEAKLKACEREKEELIVALKQANETLHAKDATSKITETRRKRILELEALIKDLRKKVTEQARLIKMKEKDEQRIRLLNGEIQSIKSKKVDLIKKMRQESERFRQWKVNRERELCKLKAQDRKRQNEMVKMGNAHSRQQNVLKRKVEEVAAINKRLKDALALRKATQLQKAGKIEHIGPWIRREVDVFISRVEAQTTLEILLEDRANLQRQADKVKEEEEEGLGAFEEELEIRSLQIADLQQKLLDCSDGDDKCKNILDNIQTMAESKQVTKTLLEILEDVVKKKASKPTEDSQFQVELEKKFAEEKSRLERQMKEEFANTEMEYENKVSVLLRQLRGVEVENMEEEIKNRSSILLQKVEKLEKDKEDLQAKITELQSKLESSKFTTMPEPATPPPPKKKKGSRNNSDSIPEVTVTAPFDEDIIEGTPMVDFDNKLQDPDWTKTKLGRRVQREKKHETLLPIKRTSQGGCNCKGTCANRTCGCKKSNNECGEGCRCMTEKCINRNKDAANKENEDSNVTDDTDSSLSPKRRKKLLTKSRKLEYNNESD